LGLTLDLNLSIRY